MELSEIKHLIREAKRSNATMLNLSYKRLTSLPAEVSELTNLNKLFLYDNQLTSLPPEISELKNLTQLRISKNQLTSLQPEIFGLKNLIELNISNNQLTSLPPEISELKNLTELYVSNNQLASLPPEISELKNLTRIYISNNQLTSLPPEISELKNLTELYVSNNQLTSLPPEISELKNLTRIYVSDNQLASLPQEISELKNLTKFDISKNQLISLPPEISELKSLIELNTSNNQLVSLPQEISELKNLIELNISNNQLASLPQEISELKNLTKFDISNNQLASLLPEISELKNLTILNVFNNQLTFLPPEISKLKNLTKIDISRNRLLFLSQEILELALERSLSIEWEDQWKSKIIFVKDNLFELPPLEIVIKGREAVINYFKAPREYEPLNEVKVLLVGEGEVGKTSLVKKLFGEDINEDEPQTQGINIRKWVMENGEQEIKVNFWDFGGQEIMRATHQFFLSKRSLYILVLDGRREEKPEYWLKLIENLGGDSPILVVINKIDQNPAFELNRRFLQEKYPSIKGFYRLSCMSNEGIKEFSKAVKEELKKVKHLEIKWPKSWFNVKNILENMCSNRSSISNGGHACKYFSFIEYNEYKRICNEAGIRNESEQDTLVDFLHDLGVILHFRDIPLLNIHVLEPEWITNAVYKIINSKDIIKSKGIIKLERLPEVLRENSESEFCYLPAQYNFIVSLMKKFELSYDLDESTILIPSLLEVEEPNFEFDYQEALKLIIDYDFIPPSVMPRFIVKMNRNIKNHLQWRTGVVLENKEFNSCAMIKSDEEAKRIYIYVNGDQKHDYLSSILFNFREINNSFEKLKAIEKIPLPDEPEIAVRHDHLVNLGKMGIISFIPEGSRRPYYVNELLGILKVKSREEELLEDILSILNNKNEEDELEEIVLILRNLAKDKAEEHDNKETLSKKLNRVVMLEPNVMGFGFNFNEAIGMATDQYFKWKKKNK